MLEVFQYSFMQRALLVSILIAIMIPMIGSVIVLRRLSNMGEALAHTSLAGVAIGLVAGLNPVAAAVIVSILSALAIEYVRRSFPEYAEIATNIVLSAGIGLAAVFSGFIENGASFSSFLFGSLVSISPFEMWLVVGLSIVVICVSIFLYKELLSISLDEEAAQLSGIPVKRINLVFTVMTAITVSIAARTVGALMISSLLVVPVACALLLARSYKQTMLYAIGFAVTFTILGLISSYLFNLKPGGTIVLVGVGVLFLLLVGRSFMTRIKRAKSVG